MKATWLGLLTGCLTVLAGQQGDKKLTARELFYSAVDDGAASAATQKKPASNPKPKPARKKNTETAAAPVSAAPNHPHAASAHQGAPVILAGYKSRPLGLRYSILKKSGNDEKEVDADTVFHAGDRIRLAVESNEPGYLYVVNRGSSGTWKLLFPAAEIKGGDNSVQGRTKYEIPSGYTFTFDEQPGEEKLFVVFSRQPEADLEQLIYSLGQGSPSATEKPKVLMASAAFSDDMIGRLRNAYARDLIIEKADDEPGPKKEKAVYTVNPTGSADSRVVADIMLKHE
jgi:hypothetical protein